MFVILAPLAPNGVMSLILLAFGLGATAGIFATPQIATQNSAPVEMRSQVAALMFLVVNIMGIGGGPLIIGLLTDYVFGDPNALKWSMSLTVLAIGPIGVYLTHRGRAPYAKIVDAAAKKTVGGRNGGGGS